MHPPYCSHYASFRERSREKGLWEVLLTQRLAMKITIGTRADAIRQPNRLPVMKECGARFVVRHVRKDRRRPTPYTRREFVRSAVVRGDGELARKLMMACGV